MRIWRWIPGWVRVEAEGGYSARFLNAVASAELAVWGVRCREERLRFCCFARDYRKMRRFARTACVRMRVRQKRGLPFWMHRYRYRKGLAVGLVLYAVILAFLSPRIWAIEVVGNTVTPSADILAVVQDMGVRIGAPMNGLNKKRLETVGTDYLPTLAWISVNPGGCVARVEVTERKPTPQILDLSRPSNMVAVRDGHIVSMTVVSGEKRVMIGEAVSAGTVLISGRVESELGEKLYRAYGEVWAQTERRITVTVPLTYYPSVADGYVAVCPTVSFLGMEIPLFVRAPSGENYVVREEAHFLQANGLILPLGVTNRYYVRVTRTAKNRTAEEAAALAAQQLKEREQALFLPGKFEEIHCKEEIRDGEYILTVDYLCLENIAGEEIIG